VSFLACAPPATASVFPFRSWRRCPLPPNRSRPRPPCNRRSRPSGPVGNLRRGRDDLEIFHHRDDRLRAADGRFLTPVLVLDQFEELFTLEWRPTRRASAPGLSRRIGRTSWKTALPPPSSPVGVRHGRRRSLRLHAQATTSSAQPPRGLPSAPRGLKATMPSVMQNRQRLTRLGD